MSDYTPEDPFSLEDIIREFGTGDSLPAEPTIAPPIQPPAPKPEAQYDEMPTALPKQAPPVRPVRREPRQKREKPAPDLYEDSYQLLPGEEEDHTFSIPGAKERMKKQRPGRLPNVPAKARGAERIVRETERKEKAQSLRLRVCLVVSVVNALLTVYIGLGLHWIGGFEQISSVNIISLVLLIVAAVAAFDVLAAGFLQLRRLRFGAQALIAVMTLAAIPEVFFATAGGRLCFASLVSLELLCALWSEERKGQALYIGALLMLKSSAVQGVKRLEGAWYGQPAAACSEAEPDQFEAMLEAEDPQSGMMRFYAPAALAASMLLGAAGAVLYKINFFWLWLALLLAMTPLSACLSYALPYCLLASRLAWKKASLCGWYGASVLSGCDALLISDEQLFPGECLKLSGVKVFGANDSIRVMRYAGAVLTAVGSHAAGLLKNGEEQLPEVRELRTYDEGGYSAELGQDTVLVGTLSFLKRMGVHLEVGSKIRQALYVSINGELAGLIALRYEASSKVRGALAALSAPASPASVLSGCDVLLSESMLKAKFRLPLEKLEAPPMRERRNCEGADGRQGALIARGGLDVLSAVCLGAKALVTAVRASVVLSVLAGVVGAIIVFILASSNVMATVTCPQMFVYLLVWAAAFAIACASVLKT